MAFCKNCGAQLNEGSKFCENCGAPVNEERTISNVVVSESKGKTEKIKKPIYKKWWFWLICAILVIIHMYMRTFYVYIN